MERVVGLLWAALLNTARRALPPLRRSWRSTQAVGNFVLLSRTRSRYTRPWGVLEVDPRPLTKAAVPPGRGGAVTMRRSHRDGTLRPVPAQRCRFNRPPWVLAGRSAHEFGCVAERAFGLRALGELAVLYPSAVPVRRGADFWQQPVSFPQLCLRALLLRDFPFPRLSRAAGRSPALPWGLSHRSPDGPAGVRVPLRLPRVSLPQALVSAG